MLERITPEDHSSWLASPCTKLLVLGLEYDEELLKQAWQYNRLTGDDLVRAQGVALHCEDMKEDIRHMLAEREAQSNA